MDIASRQKQSRGAWLPGPRGATIGPVLVAQLGARMHYAVPRILQAVGSLDRLCTDICATKGLPRVAGLIPSRLQPRALRRLTARVPEGVEPTRTTAFTLFGLDFARRQARARSQTDFLATHLWAGRTFPRLVRDKSLGRETRAVYGFNSAALELLEAARRRGLPAIVEQTIAPRVLGARLLAEEHAHFPGWETALPSSDLLGEFDERERAEWEASSLVVCGSDFVRDGIEACGGPVERCVVVPYGVDASFAVPDRKISGQRLNVLTVGEVGLRKGTPYVVAAAKRQPDLVFRMVGSTSLSASARSHIASHVELTGAVPRSQIRDQFRWADVFLLPSLYEGSATVIYEALAAGLPVICTPNAGSIVRDGIDGYIVPIRDVDAILDRLERLRDPVTRAAMSANAIERAREGQLDAYGARLLDALRSAAAS